MAKVHDNYNTRLMLLAGVIAGGAFVSMLAAQSATPAAPTNAGTKTQAVAPAPAPATAPARQLVWRGAQANRLSPRAEMFYLGVWGVEDLHVKVAESGELIRFNYRVSNPAKAAVLNDKKIEPSLEDPQAGIKLSVPQMEKVGKLRQQSTPKAGMDYWMAFSNPTLAVKRGHRVDIVIGSFRATNLVVE